MACEIQPVKKPNDVYKTILHWWEAIEYTYKFDDSLGKYDPTVGVSLMDSEVKLLDRFNIKPWAGFESEYYSIVDKNGRTAKKFATRADVNRRHGGNTIMMLNT